MADETILTAQAKRGQTQNMNARIPVTEIEHSVYQQFQQAAFGIYQQSVLNYGSHLWREARSVAHQRDPDANLIEITTPDVEAATVRVDMKLARLRQLRFPFRLVQSLVALATGVLGKTFFDLVTRPQGSPASDWLNVTGVALLVFFVGILVLYHYETRAEVLR